MAVDVTVTFSKSGMAKLRQDIDRQLGKAVRELRDIARQSVSTPYPPSSAPYDPPHMRSGGLKRAIFAERIRQMDWAFGVRAVQPDGSGRDRGNLGIWLELGTGYGRSPFGEGTESTLPRSVNEDSAATGNFGSSMLPRPFLLPTFSQHGQRVINKHLGGIAR